MIENNGKPSAATLGGVLVINKPAQMVSKDVSRWLQRRYGRLHIGHVGTLDPMATGVLPVLIGNATRLQDYLLDLPKTYEFDVAFGYETDTLDADGTVVREIRDVVVESSAVEAVLPRFIGSIRQTPPAYSAVKVNGKPLYEYARADKGDSIDRTQLQRAVHIFSLSLVGFANGTATLRARCSRGTYVRVLAKDIAEAVGSCGTVTRLVRTEASGFTLEQTAELEAICHADAEMGSFLVPMAKLNLPLASWEANSDQQVHRLRTGQKVRMAVSDYLSTFKGHDESDRLIAVRSLVFKNGSRPFGLGTMRPIDNDCVELSMRRGL